MAVATDKSWILTRSPTYRPTGALRLGQVLTDPHQPASSLFATESSYVAIPDNYILEDGELRGVSLEMDSKPVSSFRAWSKVHGAPISANLHAGSSKETRRQWTIEKLEYRHFTPELEYIRNVLKAGDVPEVTQWWRLGKRIYLVTGVRIARGAKISITDKEDVSRGAETSLNGSKGKIPIDMGLEVTTGRNTNRVETIEEADDFVFAYRLHEIKYLFTVGGQIHTGGDTEAAHDVVDPDFPRVERVDDVEITGYEILNWKLVKNEEGMVE